MSTTLTDVRRAMRDALHRLVQGSEDFARPSLAVFRNRLLDEVGSDARPLANLLVEAVERGVLEALPRTPLSPAAWSARSTPLVMRWVNDRFVQPEVARWAVEAWGFALGCIDTSQLTASVDAPEPEPLTPQWPTRAPQSASAAGSRAGSPVTAPPSTGGTSPWRGGYTPPVTPRSGPRAPYVPRPMGRPALSASSNWAVANATRVALGTAAIAVSAYIYIFASAAMRDGRVGTGEPGALAAQPSLAPVPQPILGTGASLATGDVADGGNTSGGTADADDGFTFGDGLGAAGRGGVPTTYDTARPAPSAPAVLRGAAAAELARGIGVAGQPTVVPLVGGTGGAASLAMTRLPAEGATPNAYLELAARASVRGLSGDAGAERPATSGGGGQPGATTGGLTGSANPLATTPGVPGITRNALPVRGDVDRVRRVAPATRPTRNTEEVLAAASRFGATSSEAASRTSANRASANGASASANTAGGNAVNRGATPQAAPARATVVEESTGAPAGGANARQAATPGLDQLRLRSGRRITGRTEVIQVASVVFRDAQTGLRYEFAKDDIEELITEFGTAVRFRQRAGSASAARSDRRTVSVAGRYAIRYEAARVNGSPECRDLWRGPSGADGAQVRHRAGDDTLSVAFVGGDTFPSVLDADGFFASTFRIMPGQEQLATALTTRLNGRFGEDGSLAMQITVIGYRRVQGTRGVACEITVDARGERR
jgi:hypothetical protein